MPDSEMAAFQETASRNKARVRELFQFIEQGNIAAFLALFAEDARQINPFASGLFQECVSGATELRDYWEAVPRNFVSVAFPIDEIYAMENPNVVFVRYRGEMALRDGAGVYRNQYYATLRFNTDGKIIEYIKIFNPIVAARSFGLLDQIC